MSKIPFYIYLEQNILDDVIKGNFSWEILNGQVTKYLDVSPAIIYSQASMTELLKRADHEKVEKILLQSKSFI